MSWLVVFGLCLSMKNGELIKSRMRGVELMPTGFFFLFFRFALSWPVYGSGTGGFVTGWRKNRSCAIGAAAYLGTCYHPHGRRGRPWWVGWVFLLPGASLHPGDVLRLWRWRLRRLVLQVPGLKRVTTPTSALQTRTLIILDYLYTAQDFPILSPHTSYLPLPRRPNIATLDWPS